MMSPNLDPRFLPLIFSAFIILHIPSCLCQNAPLYETCNKPFKCGDISLGYPFSAGDDRPEACGRRGFELRCEDNIILIDVESVSYRVLDVDHSTRVLKVARDDLWTNLCPRVVHNTTFNPSSPFNFYPDVKDQNIFLFYGCAPLPVQLTPYQFKCNINGTDAWSFFTNPVVPWPPSNTDCGIYISARVNESAAKLLALSPTEALFLTALKSGFWIQWKLDDACGGCQQSGGVCGQNLVSRQFACHCSNGITTPTNCSQTGKVEGKSKSKTGMAVGLSIAGAAVAGIGLAILIFYCRIRRKRRHQRLAVQSSHTVEKDIAGPPSSEPLSTPDSSNFTRSTPSYPSSNSDLAQGSTYFGAHVFNFAELEAATDNFNSSRELGDGGFGTVYYGVLHDGREVAVKRLYESNYRRMEQFMNEVEILTQLRHANLVVLYGCTSKRSRDLLLVYEYISNGTVADHLQGYRAKSGLLSWPVRLSIAIETADALTYLHKSEIVHRDIKTNNILLDKNFHVKVADFGLSRLFPNHVTHVSTAPQGTPGYVDPEYYQCYHLTEKSDVYSFGVVLIELISSLPAVDITRHRHNINLANMAINKIQNHALHELVDSSLGFETNADTRRMVKQMAELAFRCLQQERDMRPTMEQVLEALKVIQRDDINAHKVDIVDTLVDSNTSGPPKGSTSMPSPDSATPLMDK